MRHVKFKQISPTRSFLPGNDPMGVVRSCALALMLAFVLALAPGHAQSQSPSFESALAGFAADSWLAVVAPRGLPADAKAKLHKALAETLADADIRSKLVASGLEPAYAPGDAVLAQIEDELPRMRAIAQRAQIHPD